MRALVVVTVLASVACDCAKPPLVTEEICNNGKDDDRDGFTDCQDPSCLSSPACFTDCVDLCADAEGLCEGDSLKTCALGVNGCRSFLSTTSCDGGICNGGACAPPPCRDQCGVGTTTCSGSTAIVTCVKPTGGCSDWSMPQACPASQVCSSGRCVAARSCTNQCAVGTERCNAGGSVERCVLLSSGCTEWSLPAGACGGAGGGAGGGTAGGTAGGAAGGAAGGTAGGTAGSGPTGPLVFQKIPNLAITDDVSRVAWHPSGRFALLLAQANGVLYKYDATSRTLATVQTVGFRLADLEPDTAGAFFLIAGQQTNSANTQALWRVSVGAADALTVSDAGFVPLGTAAALSLEPGTDRFAVTARGSGTGPYINYLYTWQPSGLSAPTGYNASAGAMSLMWGAPSLYAGSANIVTSDGVNGASSSTWVLQNNMVVGNAWPASHGNPGGAAWQRGGGLYGILCGWSSNKLYVFDGAWANVTLPGVGTAAAPQAVAFRADGNRALIVGRVIGPAPARATVIDYRPTGRPFDPAALVESSIANFDAAPWFGNTSSMHLLDVAWRPGNCDEGLIVGSDNGTQFSPTFGTVARFYDSTDTDCVP